MGHSRFKCKLCGVGLTSLVQAEIHHDSKHSKVPFSAADYEDVHALTGGVTTAGIAVRGTLNAEKLVRGVGVGDCVWVAATSCVYSCRTHPPPPPPPPLAEEKGGRMSCGGVSVE